MITSFTDKTKHNKFLKAKKSSKVVIRCIAKVGNCTATEPYYRQHKHVQVSFEHNLIGRGYTLNKYVGGFLYNGVKMLVPF